MTTKLGALIGIPLLAAAQLPGLSWQQYGGGSAPGLIEFRAGRAILREGDSFLVSLHGQRQRSGPVSFELLVEPGFDRADRFVSDAFEVSLLDASNTSLVRTWKREATSFFNMQEDGTVHLAPGVSFDGRRVTVDVSGVPPTAQATLYFDLIGGDRDTGSGITVILNSPPECRAGGPYLVECGGSVTQVPLDGRGSSDPDGDELVFTWSSDCPGASFDDSHSSTPTLSLQSSSAAPVACTVDLLLSDGTDDSSCSEAVTVQDTLPATVRVSPMIELWPPNHDYRTFSLADCIVSIQDTCAGLLEVASVARILSIYSDELEDARGMGDGDTLADIVILSPTSFQLRAERDGGAATQTPSKANGRVYGVEFLVADPAGNTTTGLCTFGVPHAKDGSDPIDDGPSGGYTARP